MPLTPRFWIASSKNKLRHNMNANFFSALVDLMSQVVCQIYRSVNAGYKKSKAKLKASLVAVYGKLSRMELPITTALVADTAQRLAAVITELRRRVIFPGSGVPGEDR